MTENAVQLGYVSKGVIYSQTLPFFLAFQFGMIISLS